ncbi:esterase/lipase family protein [Micromonospora arida]|uniref:esterase/lipase family protein n=1 Tax=Micromonospora arida TaxID=2203715 RepID=UPI00340F7A98
MGTLDREGKGIVAALVVIDAYAQNFPVLYAASRHPLALPTYVGSRYNNTMSSIRPEPSGRILFEGDVVVILPGILGSVLERNGRQTWGYRQVGLNLSQLSKRLTEDLTLPPEAFADDPRGFDDGTRSPVALKTFGIVPGLWAVDGYDRLVGGLVKRYGIGATYVFPYDWRQSNRVTAHRLQCFVEPLVEARRRVYPAAKVVLVGHSMGGLVARYYATFLDSREYTRRVVTVGTPYSGSIKALLSLANGPLRFGPFQLNLAELVRSLPSVAELLPVFPCIKLENGSVATPTPDAVPAIAKHMQHALEFHGHIRRGAAAGAVPYHPIIGHLQPTERWVRIQNDRVLSDYAPDLANRGDGTVPRISASPPEWTEDSAAAFLPGRHATLQQRPETLRQLHGILTARPRPPMAAESEISADAEPFVAYSDVWTISANSWDGTDNLALELRLSRDDGSQVGQPIPLRPQGCGNYVAKWRASEYGVFRWSVSSIVSAGTPVEPIEDLVLCSEPH